MTAKEMREKRKYVMSVYHPYQRIEWSEYNYKALHNIMYIKRSGRGDNDTYNDVIIMCDTETSKKRQPYVFKDEFYDEIRKDVSYTNLKYERDYSDNVAPFSQLRAAGLNLTYAGTLDVDVYYEDLRERYPWIFKEEAYSKYDALYYIYEYLSKKPVNVVPILNNHVCAWTISIRAFDMNIVTLYGHKPSEFVTALTKVHQAMEGDNTIVYWHNMAYDWVFVRKFLMREFGTPIKQLNTKPHYPIMIKFQNGITMRDSLILAQRSLDKWATDMDVEHKKALDHEYCDASECMAGKDYDKVIIDGEVKYQRIYWRYDRIRDQDYIFSDDELTYIENDTLAGVECIQKTMDNLHKHIYAIPYTATGIPREEVRERGKAEHAHDRFLSMALDYVGQQIAELVYHGGYTHANRHFINLKVTGRIQCFDFASSYPYCMISQKFPMEKFVDYPDKCDISTILKYKDTYAFMFKLILIKPRLKDDYIPMPALQYSKCVKIINPALDNGRVLCAAYAEIWLTEMDLAVIAEQYTYESHICIDVKYSTKDYLPRWFTDYVFECFRDKTMLKHGDPVLYSIAKSKLNALYGMCSQKPIKDDINENYLTGNYTIDIGSPEEKYDAFLKNHNSILPYQWGVWVTAYAFYNLFQLGKCVDYANGGQWLYSDTDSCYATLWDMEKVNAYNEHCKELIMANGYGCVEHNGREYWLGVAETEGDKDIYTEFKVQGAKRYCGRCLKDGQLHITVAGVPKDGYKCLRDNIDNFVPGLIFDGETTHKRLHTYVYIDDIYIDADGNETGDSIDLTPCDYLLDSVDTVNWEDIFNEEIEMQVYE